MMHARSAVPILIATLTLAVLPSSARGESYTVHSCKEGVRESLPSTDWLREPGEGSFDVITDCSVGAITVRPTAGTRTPYAGGAGISFTAPAPLSIISMKHRQVITASKSTDPNRPWRWEYNGGVTETDGTAYQNRHCFAPCDFYLFNPGEKFERPRRSITWYLLCVYESLTDCDGGAQIRIFDAEFEIDDPSSPQLVSPPTGAMFTGGVDLTGDQTVGYEASDLGSGVYRAEIEVDGSLIGAVTSATTEFPHCTQPFRIVQPCPSRVANGITIDTRQLADGAHTATLRVYDATERNFASYGPVTFTTANRRLNNFCGSETLGLASTNVPARPLAYGKSWTFKGSTKGSVDHEVVLLEGRDRVTIVGSGRVPATGRVAFSIPPGSNRVLRLATRAPGSTGKYSCSKPSRLRVSAKLRLVASPEEVSNGRAVRLRGRLLGEGNSKRPIVVQARAVGSRRWATVRVVRTRRNGRFAMKYRFLSTFSTVTYVFRAQSRSGTGYPYATGTSRSRRVRVFGASE